MIVPVMAISNLVLARQIYSEETNGAHTHNRDRVPLNLSRRELIGPSQAGGDLFDTAVGTAADLFVDHALPWMGKKAVEMGRYYGSEALRNKTLQKKAIDYALDKLNPVILNVDSQGLDQLSTKYNQRKTTKQTEKIWMEVL